MKELALRRSSNCSITDTTISSCPSRDFSSNGLEVDNFVHDNIGQTQNNVKIENSSGIRVGDVIYNIYSPPPAEIFETVPQQNNFEEDPQNFLNDFNGVKNELKFAKTKRVLFFVLISILGFFIGIIFLIYFLVPNYKSEPNDPLPYFIPRSEWTEKKLSGIKIMAMPIKRIIVGQTDDVSLCFVKSVCLQRIQELFTKNPHLKDIPWNFLIGADGNVYEGRGYRYEGEHTMDIKSSDYNDIGIGIGLIGDFVISELPTQMITALEKFIQNSIEIGYIVTNHLIFLQDHLIYKDFPAPTLENTLKGFKNYYELQKIYKRKEWGAYDSCKPLSQMNTPLWRVIIHHSGDNTWHCPDFYNCTEELKMFQKNTMTNSNCKFFDTFYNFAIGGTKNYSIVMEARGFNKVGAHTMNYNTGSLGIGHYDHEIPGTAMMEALKQFINDSVALGKLIEDYELNIKRDFDDASSPGINVINIVQNWPNFKKFKNP